MPSSVEERRTSEAWRQRRTPTERRVELKRSSVKLGLEQFSQVVKYADAVVSDARFNTDEVGWSFWLIGNQIERALPGAGDAARAPARAGLARPRRSVRDLGQDLGTASPR